MDFKKLKEKLFGTKGIVVGAGLFFSIFLIVIIVQSCTPRKGSILYGLCQSFLELQVPFPQSMNHSYVEQYPTAVRIHYNHIDAFGEYQIEMIECTFRQDPTLGVQMDRAFFDHIKDITQKERSKGKGRLYEVQKKYIDLYNKSGSPAAIMSQDPDLSLP